MSKQLHEHYRRKKTGLIAESGFFVGAGLLAKNASPPRYFWMGALSLTAIASKLALTGN